MPFENSGHPNGLLLAAYIIGLVNGMLQLFVLHKSGRKYFVIAVWSQFFAEAVFSPQPIG